MDKIKEKLSALRAETDAANERSEEAKGKSKQLEQEAIGKEQEIASLQHRNQLLEAEVEKLEGLLKEAKAAADDGAAHGHQNESLMRKVQLLEEENEQSDRNLRETTEK